MAYDEAFAARIRAQLEGRAGLSEKKMFGGLAFFLNGNMACGVLGSEMVLKVKEPEESDFLSSPGCRPFDFTGRPMRGFVLVANSVCPDEDALAEWLSPALRVAASMPPKAPKAPRAPRIGRGPRTP